MARLILQSAYKLTIYGHEYRLRGETILIKRHEACEILFKSSSYVLTTDRPDEEIEASIERFGRRRRYSLDNMRKHLRYWRSHSNNLHQQYSDIKDNPKKCIKEIADFLNVEIDINEIYNQFKEIKPTEEYDPLTMLFPNHITK